MVARSETIFKWILYWGAAALCFLAQGFLLQRMTLWGVIPFLFPVLAAVPATYEGPLFGTAFALSLGVACDLLLAGPIPCFYTLVFPIVGLCAALMARGLLSAGLLCSLVTSAVSFFLVGGFHCLLLWVRGKAAWQAGLFLTVRELAVTALLIVPISWLFRAVSRRAHRDD